ncbi:exopolyphosphatase [Arenicella sp. 4NH20-0111]|uniref:Ppx/GppA phosphatase family protein n=1 Tax=Arenicella sp. 4NH20-0111 TaxID=3127648 RepID=UPI00310601AD
MSDTLVVTSGVTSNGVLPEECYAAVDLGSNSFHMVVSHYNNGQFNVIDRQREVVRLAAGLDQNNDLSDETANRALRCLTEFGQLLRTLPPENIRAVGTNALRRLQKSSSFLDQAESALGQSIEIIAGREEARLIYLGVSKWSAGADESRLVIDIGGGSTEIIAGKGDQATIRESLEVGCVTLSQQYFADGKLSAKRFRKAVLAAELAIQPVVEQFRLQGWNQVIGCSGTMKSIASSMLGTGMSKDGMHKEGLNRLLQLAIDAKHIDNLSLSGLSRDRGPVFAGGLSIILALFELFDIQEMSVSDIALREGVLFDLVGRSSAEDIRDITVSAMCSQWAVDTSHGDAVKATASILYKQLHSAWDIQGKWYENLLGWASQLHEIGLRISHDGYHKHGAYIVANGDMAGFARRDQLILSALITGHRRKFPIALFEELPSRLVTPAKRIAIILRLSVLLNRGRIKTEMDHLEVKVKSQEIHLAFPDKWLETHPLTEADLRQEQLWLKNLGVKLQYS